MHFPEQDGTTAAVRVTPAGNATILIEGEGARVVTDPWLSDAIGPWRRWLPPGLSTADLSPLTTVLISHAHPDHLDLRTLATVPEGTPALTPGGAPLERLRRLPSLRPREMREWEAWELGSLRVVAVPSVHTRWCLAYVVELGGRRLYFAGDSGPGTPFAEIARRCGPLDLAILPVGGSTLAPGPFQRHLTPALAAAAAVALSPGAVLPMHWGHVPCIPRVIDRFRGTPLEFEREMRRLAPSIPILNPADGESISL
jgi:L-ascorbate metabolism protein UlaG (beta-lactamase superfamily)